MDNIINHSKSLKKKNIKYSNYKNIHKNKDLNKLNSIKKNLLIEEKSFNKTEILNNIKDLNKLIKDMDSIENKIKNSLKNQDISEDLKYKLIKLDNSIQNNIKDFDNNIFKDFFEFNDDNILNIDFN